MSGISSLNPFDSAPGRARMASPFQHLFDQIDVLRRQANASVSKGALTAEQGTAIGEQLNEIEKSVQAAEADRSMSRGDLRSVAETLHDIRKEIVRVNRAAAETSAATEAPKPERDSPGALDITV